MNKAFIVGNLTKAPELKTTQSGISVCNFVVAVNRTYKDQNGDRQADFIPVIVWRGLAENCARYLDKGRKVAVVGEIQTRCYDAQDGTKRYVTEVMASDVEFLTPAAQTQSAGVDPLAEAAQMKNEIFTPVTDEDMPF